MTDDTEGGMQTETERLKQRVIDSLEAVKGVDLRVLDVRGKTSVTDFMVVVGGNSDRHVRSLAEHLLRRVREAGVRPIGVEGEREGEWILVDLGDIVVHIMLARVRDFYNLEKIWVIDDQCATGVASTDTRG